MGSQLLFAARQRIRRWKSIAGGFHLLSVAGFVLCLLWVLPLVGNKGGLQLSQELRQQQEGRQLLLEALDRIVRYQHYFHDIHGRYTRDLTRLSLPTRFASGDLEQLLRAYEISVIEVQPRRFLLLATGVKSTDRVTVDESYRLNANFVMPPPSRSYLLEEADRMLNLRSQGKGAQEGIFTRYWAIERSPDDQSWVAVGVRSPVLGERREFEADRALASIFASVSERVKSKMRVASPPAEEEGEGEPEASGSGLFKEILSASDVQEWLERARLAQHVHMRENGHYAKKWESLDAVSDYHFSERMKAAKNIRVHPISLQAEGKDFQLTLEGTSGEMMGEQFLMDRSGAMRQVRYTEALIHQLQEGTNILENTHHFQINPILDDAARPSGGNPP